MLTQEDIQKIVEANQKVFATKEDLGNEIGKLQKSDEVMLKEVFATKEDLASFKEDMREMFSDLQKSVDAYAKKADDYFQEMVMLSHKVDRHEKWLLAIADRLGMKLEY